MSRPIRVSVRSAEVVELRNRVSQLRTNVALLEASLAAVRLERDELEKELERRGGELEALRARLREEIGAHEEAVHRAEALENELAEIAGDVLSADVNRQRRGLFRRPPKAPYARRPASRDSGPGDVPSAGAESAEELDEALQRRLFGG